MSLISVLLFGVSKTRGFFTLPVVSSKLNLSTSLGEERLRSGDEPTFPLSSTRYFMLTGQSATLSICCMIGLVHLHAGSVGYGSVGTTVTYFVLAGSATRTSNRTRQVMAML